MAAQDTLTRRDFMKTGAVVAGAMAMTAKSYAQVAGASGRLRVGIIGCGGMASGHLDTLLALKDEDNVDVVAVCDIFRKQAERFAHAFHRGAVERGSPSRRSGVPGRDHPSPSRRSGVPGGTGPGSPERLLGICGLREEREAYGTVRVWVG